METKLNIDAIPDGSIGKDKFTDDIKNSIGAYPEINHGTSDTTFTFTLTPNTFHVWGKVTALDLSFGEEIQGVANEFLFQFTSGSTATTLTLPDTIKWANDEVPTIEANMIYQVSILKGLASVLGFINPAYLNYFTIEALEDGLTAKLSTNACEYRIDDGSWNTLSADTNTPSINKGQTLSFKGNLTPNPDNGIGTFTVSKAFNVEGNIMSLLYGDNFEEQIDLSGKDSGFSYLFSNCQTLQNAENLILPATTLASNCYNGMFEGCTSLTTAPQLPATTLASNCYSSMFQGCTSLVEAPQLPATTLANGCYSIMFYGCSKLNKITMLATDISANYCLGNWVYGVASSGTFVKNTVMTTLPSGNSGIPNGWTAVDYAPSA